MYIYDSVKKEKLPFEPIVPPKVSIYVCGPTVYDDAHLGHARSSLSFDLLARTLKALGYEVTMGKNFTDIDDKIIKKVQESGKSLEEITTHYINSYKEEMRALGVNDADIEPKATESLEAMESMIQGLIEKDIAYVVSSGDVYFDTSKDANYGTISHQVGEDDDNQSRVEHNSEKRNPKDFALWKACHGKDDICFETNFSKGRPGWHIECSAMIEKHFEGNGEYSIDIHGGGADLLFPHHENEAAQSRCATGHELAKYWMHNGFVNIDGEKMSKSLGNSFFVKDALKEYDGEILRNYLISVHYRNDFNFNEEDLLNSKKRLDKLYRLKKLVKTKKHYANIQSSFKTEILKRMEDDLNVSKTFAYIDEQIQLFNQKLDYLKKKKIHKDDYHKLLKKQISKLYSRELFEDDLKELEKEYISLINNILEKENDEYILINPKIFIKNINTLKYKSFKHISNEIDILIKQLENKKLIIKYEKKLEEDILTFIKVINNILGIGGKEPFSYFQIGIDEETKEKIERLIKQRDEAKKAKDYAKSDAIRDEITAMGISLMDTPQGTLWEKI